MQRDQNNSCVQRIDVRDTTAPVITCPADQTVECNRADCPELPIFDFPTVEDACASEITVTHNDQQISDGRLNYQTVRTFTAIDQDGNVSYVKRKTIIL